MEHSNYQNINYLVLGSWISNLLEIILKLFQSPQFNLLPHVRRLVTSVIYYYVFMYWLFFFVEGAIAPASPMYPISSLCGPAQKRIMSHIKPLLPRRSSRRHPKFQGRSASRGGTSWGGGLRGHGRLFAWLSATNAAPCRLFFALCVSATAVAYSGLL